MPDADAASLVLLRPMVERDLPDLLRWRSDPVHIRQMMWHGAVGSLDEVRAWVQRRTSDPDGRFWVVADAASPERAVGFAQLVRVHWRDGHGTAGLFIDPAARGHGLGRAALDLTERHARDSLGLRKVLLEVLADNTRALRFWIAAGYHAVGTLRAHHAAGDRYDDVVILEKFLTDPHAHHDPGPRPHPHEQPRQPNTEAR